MTKEETLLALVALIRRSPLSVEVIAARSQVDRNTIWFWLEGQTKTPRFGSMEKVARALGFRISYTILQDRRGTRLNQPPDSSPQRALAERPGP